MEEWDERGEDPEGGREGRRDQEGEGGGEEEQ